MAHTTVSSHLFVLNGLAFHSPVAPLALSEPEEVNWFLLGFLF